MYIISIYALREEGDEALRPITREQVEFLSTPSARRATSMSWAKMSNPKISIHALREEGDVVKHGVILPDWIFLSTPSARRATKQWQAS